MHDKGDSQAGEGNAALVPAGHVDTGSVQDILAKDDAVAGRPAEKNNVAGVDRGGEELGPAVDEFEVVLFAAVAGQPGAELHVDRGAGGGDEHADDPDEEG